MARFLSEEKTDILRAALVQSSVSDDPGSTLERCEALLEKAAGADLAVLPECFSRGFPLSRPDAVESMEGPTVSWLKDMAGRYGMAVAGAL